jgi:hypothetical protein
MFGSVVLALYICFMNNLLVSFSGGETSGFMAQYLKNNHAKLGYNKIVFVFSNTGQENEETLLFAHQCDTHFNLNLVWIEAEVAFEERKSTKYKIVDYHSATRSNDWKQRADTPFEQIIQKYGISNKAFPHCTREMKQNPIKAFGKDHFNGERYHTAIGIRRDEMDRMNEKAKELGFIYPLISSKMIPTAKPVINLYWNSMPFRLKLKGYQGNCVTCWKKSNNKLYQIAKENPAGFDFMDAMEQKYPRTGNEFSKDPNAPNRVFFRQSKTAKQILEQANQWNGVVKDDSKQYDYQSNLFEIEEIDLDGESCEVFSECSQ